MHTVKPLARVKLSGSLSVVTPHLRPNELPVSPERPYARDLLEREPFGDALTRLVDYGSGSGVVLIDAGWGNGKTTFLKMWAQKARNDGKFVASLNAWDGDYRDSPLDYISERFARELEIQFPTTFIRRWWNRFLKFVSFLRASLRRMLAVGAAATAPADGGAAWVGAVALDELISSLRDLKGSGSVDVARLNSVTEKLRRAVNILSERGGDQPPTRFVVVIDELDRCRPDYAVRFMEMVKHVFEVDHVTFVVAANSTELAHAMRGVYGSEFDSERYLERFFDIRLQLPPGTREHFVAQAVEDARLQKAFGREFPPDVLDDSLTAEQIVIYMLQHSTLSLREIHKTLNHIKVMLLFYRAELTPYVLGALVLAILRSVAREAYDALEDGYIGRGAVDHLCVKLGKSSVREEPVLEFVDSILHWCWKQAHEEFAAGLRRRREGAKSFDDGNEDSRSYLKEARLARKQLVDYPLVRNVIEMAAVTSKSG